MDLSVVILILAPVAVVVPCVIAAGRAGSRRRSRALAIGAEGERRVSALLGTLDGSFYRVCDDVLLRDGGYTTQVDHVVVSPYGIFVVETKNIHGRVYGGGDSEWWSQYLPAPGYRRSGAVIERRFRNPVLQNEGHVRALRALVFGDGVPVLGVVVFSDSTELRVSGAAEPVLHMRDLPGFIAGRRAAVLTPGQAERCWRRLLAAMSTSAGDREAHLRNVRRSRVRSDSAVREGVCPLCGAPLVPREGRYGRFLGCSGYPACRYTLGGF